MTCSLLLSISGVDGGPADEIVDQLRALLAVHPGNGGARRIGGQLLHCMGGAEIDAVGDHRQDCHEEERCDDGEFDCGRTTPIQSKRRKLFIFHLAD